MRKPVTVKAVLASQYSSFDEVTVIKVPQLPIKCKARRDGRRHSYKREGPYQKYEKEKSRLRERNLSPREYEIEIKKIVERLGI
jgi:hypothetical protein